MSKKQLFTVRMLDAAGDYITHKEHLVGTQAIAQYKQQVSATSKRRVAYVRIFNETTQHTRYEGASSEKWPRNNTFPCDGCKLSLCPHRNCLNRECDNYSPGCDCERR